jgi:hypothetical protein
MRVACVSHHRGYAVDLSGKSRRRLDWRSLVALGLVLLGVIMLVGFGVRAARTYRMLHYAREQGLDRGVADVNAIRPWMTVRYVAVAYAVPEEYLFAQIGVPYNRRSVQDTLGQLNRVFELGQDAQGEPAIIGRVTQAILDYRADPVTTGLADLRPWMTIRYIANSMGADEAELLTAVGLSDEPDSAVRPLDQLAREGDYAGGLEGLLDDLREVLAMPDPPLPGSDDAPPPPGDRPNDRPPPAGRP